MLYYQLYHITLSHFFFLVSYKTNKKIYSMLLHFIKLNQLGKLLKIFFIVHQTEYFMDSRVSKFYENTLKTVLIRVPWWPGG